jgi:hypothetical protein
MLDRVGDNGKITPGLWDSPNTIIGAGSFDTANKAACWRALCVSESRFASDQVKEIGTLKTRYTSTLEKFGEEPSPDPILSAPVIGFGYGKQKPHKMLMDVLRGNETRPLKQRAETMPRDGPRAEALSCGGLCSFVNRFPLTISQHLRFTLGEYIQLSI